MTGLITCDTLDIERIFNENTVHVTGFYHVTNTHYVFRVNQITSMQLEYIKRDLYDLNFRISAFTNSIEGIGIHIEKEVLSAN